MTKIVEIGIPAAIRLILDQMIPAGQLAMRLQQQIASGRVENHEVKEGHRFGSVLTDADVLIETLIGSFLYMTFEDATFFGEEHDKDRISAYFPKQAPYEITLDPINGTLFFKDGLPIFDMIVTIRQNGKIIAAIDYLPHQERFYIGILGQGAFTTTVRDIRFSYRDRDEEWEPLHLNTSSKKILMQRPSPNVLQAFLTAGYNVVNLEVDYVAHPDWTLATKSLLDGGVAALIKDRAHFIDWGAIGFIASLAGGQWNEPAYGPGVERASLVVATSPNFYEEIQAILAAS